MNSPGAPMMLRHSAQLIARLSKSCMLWATAVAASSEIAHNVFKRLRRLARLALDLIFSDGVSLSR